MMKRGLSTRDFERTSRSLLRGRQQPIRDELRRRGLDAALISSDISTGSDIAYLTHLTLYWSTGLLVIGADGATIFMPALSPRTENWFGETGLFDEVHSGTDLIGSLATVAGGHDYRRIGLIERDRFPQVLLREIESDAAYETEDIGGIVREARVAPDAGTLADLRAAYELADAALDRFAQVLAASSSASDAGAEAEFVLRVGGAWDAGIVSVPLGDALGVRLRVQLRDAWVAVERVIGEGAAEKKLSGELREWALRHLRPGMIAADMRAALDGFIDARPELSASTWEVVLEPACNVEARAVLAEPVAVTAGMVVHVSVTAWSERGDYEALWGNTVLIDEAGMPRSLTSEGEAG